jgi:hypothetical protein
MSDTAGSLTRHATLVACLTLAVAVSASAQTPAPPSPTPDFLTRYDFQLSGVVLAIDDPRFSWDTHFGGDLDVFDYVKGRLSAAAEYEAVLGDEFRAFDPNQSYYLLEASSSYRVGQTEIAGVFHHISRHLSDRPKSFPIAWNVLEARTLRRFEVGRLTMDTRAEVGKVLQHVFVDYSWTGDVDVMIRRAFSPRVGMFVHGYGELIGVEEAADRGTQRGGRAEAGVRFEGRAGALELFAGIERRIDADPLEQASQRWGIAGFRLVGR